MNSPSRAEQLRMRRNQRSKQRLSDINVARKPGSINNKKNSIPKPHVVTRVKNTDFKPVMKRSGSQVKKRVTIPLKSPGAELNLPALPVVASGWRLMSGFLSVILLVVIIFFATSPSFKISVIDFQGLDRVNANDVALVLNLKETPIFMVDPQKLAGILAENYPELKNIVINAAFPANVTIKAEERQPIVIWEYGDQTLWIDEEGIIFPPRSTTSNLLVNETEQNIEQTTITEMTAANSLLTIRSDAPPPEPPPPPVPQEDTESETDSDRSIKEGVNPIINQDMPKIVDMTIINAAKVLANDIAPGTKIVYNDRDGLGWSDSRGWNVYIGSKLDNIEIKLIEYQAIVDQLEKLAIKPAMISVEYINAPFYRLE